MNVQWVQQIRARARQARSASRLLAASPAGGRNQALGRTAELLLERAGAVLQANAEDCARAADLSPAAASRLKLDPVKLGEMARGLTAVAALADPLGRVRLHRLLDDDLELTQVTCPLGGAGGGLRSQARCAGPDRLPGHQVGQRGAAERRTGGRAHQ
jgi:glutamate-5-semialdehyde dehydrogenase